MKLYKGSIRDNSEALEDRFGKPTPERITRFSSVPRFGGKSYTGDQILVRYCFPDSIVYGYISSGDRGDLVAPFMLVSVFERKYLEDVLRRDIQEKEKMLKDALPVVTYSFGSSVKWNEIPFPTIPGTSSSHGVNFLKEKVATLAGRPAPKGSHLIDRKAAIVVREQRVMGLRTMHVVICFNSFPNYEMHPLMTPQQYHPGLWDKSHGNWHTEHDAQLCNAYLIGELFPSANGKMELSTVANSGIPGMDQLAHKSFKVYTWETKDKYTKVHILGNNTIFIIKREKPKID
jgi:hypothetical protein